MALGSELNVTRSVFPSILIANVVRTDTFSVYLLLDRQ